MGHPKRQLRVLLLDLYVAWKADPALGIGVHMTNSGYRAGSRYNTLHISAVMISLVHRAHEVGLIELWRGNERAGRITRIWSAEPLIRLFQRAHFGVEDIITHPSRETIVLSRDRETDVVRRGTNRYVEYEDTDETIAMRSVMTRYNELLDRTFIDIPSLDRPFMLRPSEASNERDKWVHLSQNNKFSRRIFYRGSWLLGGRIHGGFWQGLPEDARAKLHINDLPVVEDDYQGTHIALLYGMEGWAVLDDPYIVELPSRYPASQMRKWIKSLVLISINAASERSAFKAFRQNQPTGSPAKRFTNVELGKMLAAFKAKHPAIAHYLCSDIGVTLMAIDGRITSRIIEQFTNEDVPVLTIFDSYIIGGQYADELRSAMRIAMDVEVPGAATNFDRVGLPYDSFYQKRRYGTDHMIQMAAGVRNVRRSSGYLARRDAFFGRVRPLLGR